MYTDIALFINSHMRGLADCVQSSRMVTRGDLLLKERILSKTAVVVIAFERINNAVFTKVIWARVRCVLFSTLFELLYNHYYTKLLPHDPKCTTPQS